jgi:hypothetical protein
MKANVTISDYIQGRYNQAKLEKLKAELEKNFNAHKERVNQSIPEEGLDVTISMSAKYQTPYVKVENWGSYLSVGEFEDIVKESLENRGFEISDEDGDDESFKITFD